MRAGGFAVNANVLRKEFVFGDERPFQSCHASTLALVPGGDIVAAWFAGTQEGANDVRIWYSRRSGERWSSPRPILAAEPLPHWNPVLFPAIDGTIHLYYKIGRTIPEWRTFVVKSADNGRTWTEPVPLVEGDIGGRGPVKNKPIVLHDGTWLAPASVESDVWDAFADMSRDGGKTWTKSALVPIRHASVPCAEAAAALPLTASSFKGKGIIQPALWESRPGVVHMLLRSTEGYIYRSDSTDGGRSWSPAYRTSMPNNNSGIDLVKLNNGALALVCNPVSGNWAERTPLTLFVSEDNGETWKEALILEDGPGEFSYPAVVCGREHIFITYTWKRERIAFCQIRLE